MTKTPRTKWRLFRSGLATAIGIPRGFYSPYNNLARNVRPTAYPELEPVFAAASPAMEAHLDEMERLSDRLASFSGPPPEPRWDQVWFPRLDGAAAYAMVRTRQPRRIVEVGSGHSTRFMARAAIDAGGTTAITCIDPMPRADFGDLDLTWRQRMLGEADIPLFAALEPGDIAFFDSSHLLWPGSDVDLILNRILPVLRPGVIIHVHDIFLPDAYIPDWTWRGYTEALGLGGWLAGGGVKVLFASHYARTRLGAAERPGIARLPIEAGSIENSLWLERG